MSADKIRGKKVSLIMRKLDVVVSDILGLTQSERDAVYEAVIQLVESRLKKARSV